MTSIRVVIVLIALAATLAVLPNASADEDKVTIWGQVHTSGGDLVLNATRCQTVDCHATITVKVFHAGEVREFNTSIVVDPPGSYYTITLSHGAWSPGDAYEIWVDGVAWGDVYYKAYDNPSKTGTRVFTMPTAPSPFGDVNRNLWAYASATGSQPIGEIVRSGEDVELFQTREVSVSRIVKNPDGTFAWFDPQVVPLKDAAKQLRAAEPGQAAQVYTIEGKPLETMDGVMLEGLWRSGGKVTLHTGQEAKQAISRLKTTNFLVYGLPFFVVELLLGGVSAMTHPGLLSVPPFGLGLAVNLLILLVGVFGHITFFVMPTRPKLEKAKPGGLPGPAPEGIAEPP